MNYARLDNARDDGTHEGNGEGVIDMEFEGPLRIIVVMLWENVEEGPNQIEGLACHVGHLEYRTYSLRYELAGGLNRLCTVLYENWNFAGTGRFQNPGQLSNGFLENLRRADINFGDYNHHRHIQGHGNP